MKKLVTVFMMFLYMASAMGFSFSLHYCGGHYKQLCFTSDTEEGCCGESEHKSNCCEDKVISAKYKDDHTAYAKIILPKMFFADAAPVYPSITLSGISYNTHDGYVANDSSPPIVSDVPIYLMNRVLRI